MTRTSMLLMALLLTACNDSSPPPPTQGISLNPAAWTIGPIINGQNQSVGMPVHPSADDGWSFQFPESPGHVNYIDTSANISAKNRITMTFQIIAEPTVQFLPKPDQWPQSSTVAKVRLYFQRAGDDWSHADGRWWSTPLDLTPGTHTVTAALVPEQWTNVNGGRDGFAGAKASSARVGFTFGGDFAGHGALVAGGPARFILKEYKAE